MGNGAQVRSEGTVKVAMSVKDAEGRRTLAHDIKFEILPEGPATPILLGKPWKTQMGVIQFSLHWYCGRPRISRTTLCRRQHDEIEDQAAQWTLSTDEYAQSPKKVWLEQPIERGRLKTLQHLLPVEVDNPEYQAACRQNHINDCKQNHVVICNPKLIEEPPDTAQNSKTQALLPPQKEFLHQQVCELIDNGFLIKVPGDQIWWISETHIVLKPAAEIESNVSIEELQCQVNTSLKATGLEHDPNMPNPTPLPTQLPEAQTTKAHYRLVHNYTPINHYMCDTAFVPGDITIKASKLSNKKFLFKGDGCAGFFIVTNSPLATLLSVTYIKDLGFCGYMVMPFGFKVGPSLYYQFITTAFGNLFDQDNDFWMEDVAAGHQDFGAYFTWLQAFLD
ncbi:uncharacterized protein UBRO_20531 [Ustilago bromivora]|uniref:Uncharacterized protein n=1 Tax=Ustilago bromivora TaxID=307758 RepID=A0A1K0FZM2_9BASI|nr:uncharacterized protein UBRO_20531 [Ustilago bromivora]